MTTPRRPRTVQAGIATGLAILAVSCWLVWPRPGGSFDAVPWETESGRVVWVARHELSVKEWNACAAAGGCRLTLKTRAGQDPAKTPATGLSWIDAMEYLNWANKAAKGALRLPTAEEWQAMAKPVLPPEAEPLFTDPELSWASAYLIEDGYSRALQPIGSHSVTSDGIADLDGPVWEWTSDCFDRDAPQHRCPAFFAGGLHVSAIPLLTRDPARGGCAVGAPPAHLGMRLVSDYPPSS
ncbi:MAG: SUMF1/EgtB/PvdO family nonheme iron enzyme [Pseudomonadota bacterium]